MDIFVRNLAAEVDESDLLSVFGRYGTVESVTLVADKETGRRMGFGFVNMPVKDEAVTAINALAGMNLKGQSLEFQDSRTRFERRQNRERRGAPRETPERRRGERRQNPH